MRATSFLSKIAFIFCLLDRTAYCPLYSDRCRTPKLPEACASSLERALQKFGKSKFTVQLKCSLTVGVHHQVLEVPLGGLLDGPSDGYPLDDPL